MTEFPPPGGAQGEPWDEPSPPPATGPAPPPYGYPPPPGGGAYPPAGYPPPPGYPVAPGYPAPPGYPVGYGPPPSPLSRGLVVTVQVMLGLGAALALAAAGALFSRASKIENFESRTFRELDDADNLVNGWLGGWGLGFLATAVVFIIWQHRHATNAERLAGPLRLGPGWAVGGWFVPIGNLVLPALQLREASRASDPGPLPPGTRGRPAGIILAWAIVFGIGSLGLIGAIGQRPTDEELAEASFSRFDDVTEEFRQADNTAGVAMVLFGAAGVLAAVMVGALSARQLRAVDARAGTGAPGWPTPGTAPPPPGAPTWPPGPAPPGPSWPPAGSPPPGSYPAPPGPYPPQPQPRWGPPPPPPG
ncbi:MAG: DUF4328 domain-containing protein [Acidimicrobiia bacterium]